MAEQPTQPDDEQGALVRVPYPPNLREAIDKIIDLVIDGLGIDGGHHKQWFLEQILRAIVGDEYDRVARELTTGSDGIVYGWEAGIAP